MEMVFVCLFVLPFTLRKILAFDLFKTLSANFHILRLVSHRYKTPAIRNQGASSAGTMRGNRTQETLMMLSATLNLEYWTS